MRADEREGPLCPYHARNETWWQVPVARDVFVTVTVTVIGVSY